MKLLDNLKATFRKRELTHLERLKKIRLDAADEKEIDYEELADVLEELNLSPEDFQEQVEKLKYRRELYATFQKGEKASSDMPAIQAAQKRRSEEHQVIADRFQDEMVEIRKRLDDCRSSSLTGGQAQRLLSEGATCPDFEERRLKCNTRIVECSRQLKELREFFRERNVKLDNNEDRAAELQRDRALEKELDKELKELKILQEAHFEESLDPNCF